MNETALFPRYEKPRWHSRGLTERQERVFNWIAALFVAVMMSGWVVAIVDQYHLTHPAFSAPTPAAPGSIALPPPPAAPVTGGVADAILSPKSSSTVYIDDAALTFLTPLRGYSGKVNAVFRTPGDEIANEPAGSHAQAQLTEPDEGDVEVSPDFTAPEQPGIYDLAVQIDQARKEIDDLKIVTLVPFSEKRGQKIGLYYLGSWPFEGGGQPKTKAYSNPSGFIKVTAGNRTTNVSEHFQLQDFLTKDQPNVWPKYLLLSSNLLDKLELIIEDLKAHGYKVSHVTIMSGFRTPRYNAGGGNTQGRANLSRHMYGDASDIFVDNNRDRYTDDLNGDGKVNVADVEIIAAAAERVERRYPSLVGGVGVYQACCGHGPFVHVDVRGYRARWRGTGNG